MSRGRVNARHIVLLLCSKRAKLVNVLLCNFNVESYRAVRGRAQGGSRLQRSAFAGVARRQGLPDSSPNSTVSHIRGTAADEHVYIGDCMAQPFLK